MRKPHSVAVVDKVISLARKKGFLLYGSYMLGFPWQTIEDMLTEVSLAKTLDVDYWSFNTVAAFPGTDLFAFCKRHGFLADNVTFDDLSLYSGNIATPSFSTHDVERICKEAFIEINFASKEKIRRAAEIFGVPVEEIERRKERAQFFLNNPQEGEP